MKEILKRQRKGKKKKKEMREKKQRNWRSEMGRLIFVIPMTMEMGTLSAMRVSLGLLKCHIVQERSAGVGSWMGVVGNELADEHQWMGQ